MEIAKKNLKVIVPGSEAAASQKSPSSDQTDTGRQISIAEKNDLYEVSRRTPKEKGREEESWTALRAEIDELLERFYRNYEANVGAAKSGGSE